MKVFFDQAYLRKLYYGEPQPKIKLSHTVVRQYVKVVNRFIRAKTIQDLKAIKSLHIEKLKGRKDGISSARINQQYRLEFTYNNEEEITIRFIRISKHYE